MWLWRRRRPKGKELFFIELLGVSSLLHVVAALFLVVCNTSHHECFSLEVHRTDTKKKIPVLFLSRRGRCAALRSTQHHATASGRKNSKASIASKKSSSRSNVDKQKKIQPPTKLNAQKNQKAQTTMVDQHEKKKKQKAKPVSEPTKELKKEEIKPVIEKPKEEPKSELIEQTKEAEALVEEQQNSAAGDPEEIYAFAVQENGSEIGEDYEAMPFAQARIYIALQEELSERWKPPVGLAKELACIVGVRINHDGSITDVAIKEPSGVLIYDISARQAVQQMELPSYAWGKEYSIAFRQ